MNDSLISISLKDVIQTGEFGPIKLGMSRDEVIAMLGEPTDVSINSSRRSHLKPTIIKYGDIEFYFTDETDRLYMIYFDHVSEFRGGGSRISLDSWIIKDGTSRKEVEKVLDEIDVKFVEVKPWDSTCSQIKTDSGVELVFVEVKEDYSPPVGLFAFYLKDKEIDE
jgi:hypothetical protein